MNIREYAATCMRDALSESNHQPCVHFGYMEEDKPWQVIFKTHDHEDYCRETRPVAETLEDIKLWALNMCDKHNLASARIERW